MSDYKTETSIIDPLGKEWEAIVYFDYQPYEAQTLNYPGCDADIAISSIDLGNGNLIDLDSLDSNSLDKVTQDCWDYMEVLLKE